MATLPTERSVRSSQQSSDDAELHRDKALQASQNGRQNLALNHMAKAVELSPSAEYRFQMGSLLAHAGQYEQSLRHFDDSVRMLPNFAEGWYFKGIALLRLERNHEALPILRQALFLAPDNMKILRSLADLEFRIGYPDDALPLWERLHQLWPDDIDIILKKGETFSRLGASERAIAIYSEGIHRTPDSADLWMALAQAHDDHGDRSEAEHAFLKAMALRPDWPFAMAGLLGLLRSNAPEAIVERARLLLDSSKMTDHDRSLLGYALGKVMDTRTDYVEAMARWDDANGARRRMIGSFEPANVHRRADNIIGATSTRNFASPIAGAAVEEERLIFIVGMPRSGTTLTEQIIAAHPLAFGCGELPDIALISRSLALDVASEGQTDRNFTPLQMKEAIHRYRAAATRHAPSGAMRLIDKAPLNFWDLDLIVSMFPQGRIVWCRRDPRDIAISIYGENFALDEKYATDLSWILEYTDIQQKLMRHWQEVLPNAIHELQYEQLVSSPEAEARRLIAFTGLDWDYACLDFHRSTKGIQSPSRWQVKQPMHTRSIGRWRCYENLKPALSRVLVGYAPYD